MPVELPEPEPEPEAVEPPPPVICNTCCKCRAALGAGHPACQYACGTTSDSTGGDTDVDDSNYVPPPEIDFTTLLSLFNITNVTYGVPPITVQALIAISPDAVAEHEITAAYTAQNINVSIADYVQTVSASVVIAGTTSDYTCGDLGCLARRYQLRAGAGFAMNGYQSTADLASVVPYVYNGTGTAGRRMQASMTGLPLVSIEFEMAFDWDISDQLEGGRFAREFAAAHNSVVMPALYRPFTNTIDYSAVLGAVESGAASCGLSRVCTNSRIHLMAISRHTGCRQWAMHHAM